MKIHEQFEIKNLKRLRVVTYDKAFCHTQKIDKYGTEGIKIQRFMAISVSVSLIWFFQKKACRTLLCYISISLSRTFSCVFFSIFVCSFTGKKLWEDHLPFIWHKWIENFEHFKPGQEFKYSIDTFHFSVENNILISFFVIYYFLLLQTTYKIVWQTFSAPHQNKNKSLYTIKPKRKCLFTLNNNWWFIRLAERLNT